MGSRAEGLEASSEEFEIVAKGVGGLGGEGAVVGFGEGVELLGFEVGAGFEVAGGFEVSPVG